MPDTALAQTRWKARLALVFERRGERSVLAFREHDGPLVVQKPLHPEGPGVCHAIVVHPPGGIAAGDELVIRIEAREGAQALLTTPGAAKWYRSNGARAVARTSIVAGEGAAVEWLPQETIVFDGARADIEWEAHLDAGARLIAWDIVRLGRTASGERFESGDVRSTTRIWRDGKLAWVERARIEAASAAAASMAALGGEPVYGTFACTAEEIDIATLRETGPAKGEGAVTRLPGLVVARYRGSSCEAAREWFVALWSLLRPAVMGREAAAPRIWST